MDPHRTTAGDALALLARRRSQIENMVEDNKRLAASYVALKQDVLAAEQEVRRLSDTAVSIKSENDVQARLLRERFLQLEDEARPLQGIDAEIDRVRNDVKEMREEREKTMEKLRDVEGQLVDRKNDRKKVDEVRDQIEILRGEIQRGRAAVEFERKLHSYNSELEEAMEKHLISLARESEKLCSEMANAETRGRMPTAVVPAPNQGGPDYHENVYPIHAGNSLPDPNNTVKQV